MSDIEIKGTRAIEAEVRIEASCDAVWRALTDAEEISRWFSLDAKVENPGEGALVWVIWGPGFDGYGRVEIWEPNKRYRQRRAGPPQESEAAAKPERNPIAMTWELEAQGGSTLLKLVHSGFGAGADWDDEFNNTKTGWALFLLNLRHYVERHAGRPALHFWDFVALESGTSVEAVWNAALGANGLAQKGKILGATGSFSATTIKGDVLEGRFDALRPPKVLGAVLTNYNDALLRVSFEEMKGACYAAIELITWDVPKEKSEALMKHLGEIVRAAANAKA